MNKFKARTQGVLDWIDEKESTRRGSILVAGIVIVVLTLSGLIYDKAFAQCEPGSDSCTSTQMVKHFKAGDLGRSHGVHPRKRFAHPGWTRDWFATRIRNRLQSKSPAQLQKYYDRVGVSRTGSCDLLCLSYTMYDDVMANANCTDHGPYAYRTQLCAGLYGSNPITKQNVKDGGKIALCGSIAIVAVVTAGKGAAVGAGLGGVSCLYDFLSRW